MKKIIIVTSIGLILFTLFVIYARTEVTYVSSKRNIKYLVRDLPDKNNASEVLDKLHVNMMKLIDYLYKNISKYSDNSKHIQSLHSRTRNLRISEGTDSAKYTTYTVNKGEEIVFCLRSKQTGQIHDVNLLTFVAIHELAHIACPELNHTPLFISIFVFFLDVATKIGIYQYVDFSQYPTEYCGMQLNVNP